MTGRAGFVRSGPPLVTTKRSTGPWRNTSKACTDPFRTQRARHLVRAVYSVGMKLVRDVARPMADLRVDWTDTCPIEGPATLWDWIEAASRRMHRNILVIALANKLTPLAWAVLTRGVNDQPSRPPLSRWHPDFGPLPKKRADKSSCRNVLCQQSSRQQAPRVMLQALYVDPIRTARFTHEVTGVQRCK